MNLVKRRRKTVARAPRGALEGGQASAPGRGGNESALADDGWRHRHLFEDNPLPMWIIDPEGMRFLDVNQAAVRTYGYSRDEFLSMTTFDLRLPEDIAAYRRYLDGRDASKTTVKRQTRHRRRDGGIIDVEVTAHPLIYEGRLARLVLINDITERKRAEEELRASEERYRELFDLNPSPMFVYDIGTLVFVAVNEAMVAQYGYSREEFSRLAIFDLFPPEGVPAFLEALGRRDPQSTVRRELRHRRKDGTIISVETLSSPYRHQQRNLRIVLAMDVTERKRMEEALRESEERFRATFEQAAVGMGLRGIDPRNPRWLRVNQKLADILGYTREELLRLSSVDITPPEDRDEAISYNERLLRGELTSYSREKRYLRKDGSIIWANISLTAVRGPDGKPTHVISVIEDITDRKRAEQSLHGSEERLRTVVERLAEGIALFGRDDRLVLCNEAYRRMQSDIAEQIVPGTPFEAIARARAAVMVAMGEAKDVESFTRERLAQHRNATGTAIERKRRDGGYHIIRETRTPAGETVVAFTDITELRKREQALANERNLLRSILESLLDHVFVKDREGRYILINASARKARGILSETVVVDKTVFDILPREEAAAAAAEDQSVVSTGLPLINREEPITLKSGETRWYFTAKVPLRDPAGGIIGVIGINRDVTELRHSAEEIRKLNVELEQRVVERTRQLEAVNKELESFAYSVSHDLRAPLRSMDGFSQALQEDYGGRLDDTGKDYLRRARGAAQRMTELVDDLLTLSRVSRVGMRSDRVDLGSLAQEILDEMRRHDPEREVTVKVEGELVARGDPNLLRVALHNLLDNAWKFTARKSDARIEVGAGEHDGKRAIFVRDNGAGFDMAYAGKLFGAFQRLHGDADFPGTGIGLATVQRIIHRHGGEVWAEAAPDRGATFYFTLGDVPAGAGAEGQ